MVRVELKGAPFARFSSCIFLSYGLIALWVSPLQIKAQEVHDGASEFVGPPAPLGVLDLFKNETLSKARSACMSGESFRQTYSGKSHTRTVSRMSNGYFYGIMLSYSRAVCEQNKGGVTQEILASQAGIKYENDTLSHYGASGDPLIQNYSLLLPLGMIESSGQYNEGRDKSASNVSAETVEAGLFQVSYNSRNLGGKVMNQVYQELLGKYGIRSESDIANNSQCMTGVFSKGQKLSNNEANYGSGPGLLFQSVMKKCPALATDYMSALLRVNKKHNGPLNRKEAQPRQECVAIMQAIKTHLSKGGCDGLASTLAQFPNDPRANEKLAVNPPIDRGEIPRQAGDTTWDRDVPREMYEEASRSRDLAADLEAERSKLPPESEDAKELARQVAELQKNAGEIENDRSLVKAKIVERTQALAKLEDFAKSDEFKDIEKAAEEATQEAEAATKEAQDLRAKAANENDPDAKAALIQEALEKEKLAKEKTEEAADAKERALQVRRDIESVKKQLEDLKKKDEELKKVASQKVENLTAQIDKLRAEITRLRTEIAQLKADTPTSGDIATKEAELKANEEELSKLTEALKLAKVDAE